MKPNIPHQSSGSEVVIKRDKGVTFVYNLKPNIKKAKVKKFIIDNTPFKITD